VALVIGTRPQIIKSAPIIKEAVRQKLQLDVVHTGQHYDYELSRVFFNELELPDPVVNLGVGSGSHAYQTGRMLIELEKTYEELKPDVVLVPGDTNSTLAGALAAVKMGVPVAHVEAGARSFDRGMAEEVNRVLTDHCSSLLFTVSENCSRNLAAEGIEAGMIHLVGDTMYESIQGHMKDIEGDDVVERLGLEEPFAVLTIHRAENTDNVDRLRGIIGALKDVNLRVVFPCHPRTKKRLGDVGLLGEVESWPHMALVEPLGYFSMLRLVGDADVVLTDSGGLQKEAFWLGTPCITLRDNTEWRETIELGMNVLTGADSEKIEEEVRSYSGKIRASVNPYDYDGASGKIVETLLSRYET
jgi:UDP-N-acetylglucosamine 2-epimerase (non-hydrolysing)